jgi:polyisoprenoid-binding protein YceI
MESITSTDVASEDLDIHLKSDEFFAVESYPEARLDIIEASESELFGRMRIRGEEKLVRFPVVITIDEDTVTTITQFALDRTHW